MVVADGTVADEERDVLRGAMRTLTDNAISWLEPTAECNLRCDGCYRENRRDAHKPLDEIMKDLDVFQALRKSDCMSIAGGDPLELPIGEERDLAAVG